MPLQTRPSRLTASPYRPDRLARWCAKATVAVGRESRTGWIEIALGSRVVDSAKIDDGHFRCWVLEDASDALVARLAELERAGVGDRLDRRVEALDLLVKNGLPLRTAGQALGLANRYDACRLHSMQRLDSAVLRALSDGGKSENHGRWLLGLQRKEAIELLATDPSVGELKKAAAARAAAAFLGEASEPASVASPLPSPVVDVATANETVRIGEWLGTPVRLEWQDGRGCLSVGFTDAGSLAGVLEKLGRGHGEYPAPPQKAQVRWAVFPLESLDELAYLTGQADR